LKAFVRVYTCFLIHNKSTLVGRHLIEGWQAAELPNTFGMQQQQNSGCTLEYQSLKLAFARPSSAGTAVWQAGNGWVFTMNVEISFPGIEDFSPPPPGINIESQWVNKILESFILEYIIFVPFYQT